jgi:hypothetical protein
MSNFNVLARRFAARLLRRGAPTRRASEIVGPKRDFAKQNLQEKTQKF